MKRPDAAEWKKATDAERMALVSAETWTICDLPDGFTPLPSTMVYKIKQTKDGLIDKYKARLCARGDRQQYGIDYEETFAPVVRFATIRMLLAIATTMQWLMWQLDVDSAFLYGLLREKVYLQIPNGFYEEEKKAGKVLRLDKSLYGLKQAGRVWYQTLENHLQANGFTNCSLDRCAFIKRMGGGVIIVLVYVDDLVYTASNTTLMEEFKEVMSSKFKMKDLGLVEYVVGLRVRSSKNSTHLSQSLYEKDIFKDLICKTQQILNTSPWANDSLSEAT